MRIIRKSERSKRRSTDPDVVIVSRETPDGGKPGVMNGCSAELAARLIVEEKADLATAEEAAQFRAEVEAKWKTAQEAPTLTEGEVRALRTALKPQRKARQRWLCLPTEIRTTTEALQAVRDVDSRCGEHGGDRSEREADSGHGRNLEDVLDVLLDHAWTVGSAVDDPAADRSVGRGGDAADEAVARAAHAGDRVSGRVQQPAERPVSGEVE